MYMDYAKLWKLLIDKGMTKTELMQVTGISSRVLAKLSKNQTVTTDTVARICAALKCGVGDIMECAEEKAMSLYQRYRRFGKVVAENELCKTVTLFADGLKYVVYVTKKAATKATQIHCRENGTVYWVQFYPFGGMMDASTVETALIKPARQKDEICIVLITGRPAVITGLDEGIFVSAKQRIRKDTDIYVMSETAFKLFS